MSGFIKGVSNLASTAAGDLSSGISQAKSLLSSAFVPPALSQTNFPNYIAKFSGTDANGNKIGPTKNGIILPMPEQFDIQTSSEFQPLFPGASIFTAISNLAGGHAALQTGEKLASGAQALTGYSSQNINLSKMIWLSTSPLTLTIPFQLNALYSAKDDVIVPVQQLLALTLPTTYGGGMMRAPGPDLITSKNKSYNSKYKINLSLGRTVKFTNIIILNVSAQLDTINDAKGHYISAAVHVSLCTDRIYSVTDLEKAFSLQAQSTYAGGKKGGLVAQGESYIAHKANGVENFVSNTARSAENLVSNGATNAINTFSPIPNAASAASNVLKSIGVT